MAGEDRTEAATPRKRQDVRRRGQAPKSHDLASMVVLVGLIVCIHALGGSAAEHLRRYMQGSLGGMAVPELTPQSVFAIGAESGLLLLRTIGPFVLTAILLGVIVNMLQTGFLISTQALAPDFNRLNPLTGAQRLLSGRGMVEAVKASAKLAIVGYIGWATIDAGYPQIVATIRQDPVVICATVGDVIYRLALRIALFLLVLSALDYAYQRWSFEKSIRMTKEEVRKELRESHGNPEVRSQVRKRQRQMAKRRRMMDAIPSADVIVTNPTHYAIALKYDGLTMGAPQVVAKGADLLAQRIRDLGEEHDVPVVRNAPLARTLYRTVDIGREIPSDLYAAVAEVLAFVYQIDRRKGHAAAV